MSEDMNIGNGVLVRLLYTPSERHVIVESIKDLGDAEYQQREWTKGPQDRYGTAMPYITRTLLDDDLDHLDVCIEKIDIFFYNDEEASSVQDLCYFLMEEIEYDINDDVGNVDIEYMRHPKWPQLMAKAAAVYEVMRANNEKYNFSECLYMFNNRQREYIDWEDKFRLARNI